MKKQDKRHKAPAEPPSKGMSIDAILEGLDLLEDWRENISFCKATMDILTVLQDEGIKDPEQVRDLIHDYNALAKQYQGLHQKYEEPAPVIRLGSGARAACLCPECHNQSRPGNAYCWNCGKRLDWRRRP